MSETEMVLAFNGAKFFSAFIGGLIFLFVANHFKWYDAEYLFMFGLPLLIMFAVVVSVERRRGRITCLENRYTTYQWFKTFLMLKK